MHAPVNDNWPQRADGSNKMIGEMTAAERRAVMLAAKARFIAKGDPLKAAMAQVVVEAAR